jgi:ferredoxin
VAIVGAGPTGLAAAFHLRREGHTVTIFEAETVAGGRLRQEFAQELPQKTLDAEIDVILRLGIELRPDTRVGDQLSLDELRGGYDAVLVACGAIDKTEATDWGLALGSRGINITKGTFETNIAGVFAAGNAIRGKGLVVRSVADGKEAAAAIGQFLAGKPITPVSRPFTSRMGRVQSEEMHEFLARAADAPRLDAGESWGESLSLPVASQQANRCLACGCVAQGNCKLERYAAMYGADATKLHGDRRPFVQVNREGSVIYEPGKCINCELCIQIAAEAKDALGLTFVGRGFDVRVGVPFEGTIEEALGEVAAKCIAACPTGALYLSPLHSLVDST